MIALFRFGSLTFHLNSPLCQEMIIYKILNLPFDLIVFFIYLL